ncbi:hypothetical protein CDAR_420621 [Caerostris darwini]|uniref:Uncharacterized protein n=1 Tax=Caerostris darwini TaxID=1538125 RepID=A0AAV4QG95_9ARAC|nr:hypothetical protein CDAR_420621 [Caerostris darwini]
MLSCNRIKITQWNSLTTDCLSLAPKSSSRGTTSHSLPSTRMTSLWKLSRISSKKFLQRNNPPFFTKHTKDIALEVKSQPILQSPDLTSQRSPCIYLNLNRFLALTSSNKRIPSTGIIPSFRGSGTTAAFYWGNKEAAVIDMAFRTTSKTKQTESVILRR